MFRRWAPRDTFHISKFPDTISFVIIPEMFCRNLTKIDQIYIPYKFAQSGCIPPKIKCEISAPLGSQTTRHARRLSCLLKLQTNRTKMGPPGVNRSRFIGKSNPLEKRFFTSITQRNVEEDDTIMSKVAKGKRKTRDRNRKNPKMCLGARQRIDKQLSNYDSRRFLMFLYQDWYFHKEKETSLLTLCMANFGLTVTSSFENWTPT